MSIKTALLLDVATKLLANWKKRLSADDELLLPDDLELAAGIKNLAERHPELLSVLTSATGPTKDVLAAVEEHVLRFQNEIGVLKEDGILGRRSLSELLSLFACHDKDPNARAPLPAGFRNRDAQGRDTNELWFLYHIERTPNIPDARRLIRRAWESWMRVALVRAWEVPREQANVIIDFKFIDGGGSILGESHVGPPNGFVLELDIDSGHSWNPTRYQGAMCHEIGHIIGLRDHTPGDGHLMSASIREGIVEPSEEDARRARNLPHLGPPPDRPAPPPPLSSRPDDPQLLQELIDILRG